MTAEFFGTFILVFSGTLSASLGQGSLGIGLAFAAGAIGAIYIFGHVSGAHLNPAVSVSMAARGRFPWKEVVPYVVAQIVGGIAASLLNASIIGLARVRPTLLGSTRPGFGFGPTAAIILEMATTFILVLTVLSLAEKESLGAFAGLVIGFVYGINVMISISVSGGSMNPARSFGPALISTLLGVLPTTAFELHWIYWLAPLLGGLIAALVHWIKS